jgi:acyl dehydratase
MARIFATPAELLTAVGEKLGPTDWLTVKQERINGFADATGDHQWNHVDPARAAAGPFGAPIAHGYLTLSLVNLFLPDLMEVRGTSMGVNYGTDKVRFPSAVKVGARIRARGEVIAAEPVKDRGVQVIVRVSIDIEGGERPACVADTISRFFPA